ncbi:MAG: hypothetical protein KAR33_12395 [Candidatus Thorarchaeota archaeon]|nr:hypothetical protein [Candidatus Thorarchaeota archaeon]
MYRIKYRPIIMVTCLAILLSLPLMSAGPMEGDYVMSFGEKSVIIESAEVWSDDFNDGDISDWTIFGVNFSQATGGLLNNLEFADGNFSVEDGSLRATGPAVSNAWINSTTAYGTWSFDVDVVDTYANFIGVSFISVSNFSDVYGEFDYLLYFSTITTASIGLGWTRRSPTSDAIDFFDIVWLVYPGGLSGWYHIDITRDDDNFFYVYVNGSYAFGIEHSVYVESDYFLFQARNGSAIDNIEIHDITTIDLVPPVFSHAFADQTVALGADFRYDVNATDSSGIDTSTWSVNNSATFAINADGVITNTVALGTGYYGLEVSIDDTWGNTATDSFTIIVGGVAFDYTLLAIGGALVIVALVVGVYCFKKRSAT